MIQIGEIKFVVKDGRPYIVGPRTSNELPLSVATLIMYAVNLKSQLDRALENKNKDAVGSTATRHTKINVNQATIEVLDLLPGIGAVTAKAIVAAREQSQFEGFEDLQERTEVTLKSEVSELIEF